MTLRERLELLDPRGMVTVEWIIEHLDEPVAPAPAVDREPLSWREKLWTVPPETRIGVQELAEAVGRSRDWCYRHTSPKADSDDRLPHRKLDGELVFIVAEIRDWIRSQEDVIHVPRGMLRRTG